MNHYKVTQAKRVTEQRQKISGRKLWLTSTAQSLRKWSVPASEVALSDDNGEHCIAVV